MNDHANHSGPAGAGGAHVFSVRVYYEDTDAAGVVYYANYLRFAERARTEMMRELGVENPHLMADEGLVFAVRHCRADYLMPARLDDELQVLTRLLGVGGASIEAEQRIQRGADEVARLYLKLACVNTRGRPARLPVTLRRALETLQATNKRD